MIAAAITVFLLADVVSSVNHALNFVAVVTAAAAGASRYAAVLAGSDKEGVERATAVGFYLGATASLLLLLLARL